MAISTTEITRGAEMMGCTSRFVSVLNRVAFEQNLAEGKGAKVDPGGRTSQAEGPTSAEAGGGSKLGEFRGKQGRSSREVTVQPWARLPVPLQCHTGNILVFLQNSTATQAEVGNFSLTAGFQDCNPVTTSQSEESHVPCSTPPTFCL